MTLTQSQKKQIIALIIVALLFLAYSLYQNWEKDKTSPTQSGPVSTSVTPAQREEAKAKLATLTVAPKIEGGYERNLFGSAWADVDKNKCDTRNDMLKRDLTQIVFKTGSDCTVESGVLNDPYTGKTINFMKGHGALVDIDHIVALGEAYASGAGNLTADERKALANDPENLLAVDAPANRAKGDKNASEWLPPNKNFVCSYVVAQIHVKAKYKLSVNEAEKNTLQEVLTSQCG